MTFTRRVTRAQRIAQLCPLLRPRVWSRGGRVRVYLSYPRPYHGCRGGGELGHLHIAPNGQVVRRFAAPPDIHALVDDALRQVGIE